MTALNLESTWRTEDGARLAATVWRAGAGRRAISSAMVGGGLGPVHWVLNAQVPGGYSRTDRSRTWTSWPRRTGWTAGVWGC